MAGSGQFLAQTQQQRLQMVLAPQLRQSLHLLQVPILELQSLLQQEIQQNPALEEKLEAKDPIEVEPGTDTQTEDLKELDFKEEFEVLAQLDDEWRDYFQQNQVIRPYSNDEDAKREFFLNSLSQSESLQEHLLAQLPLAGLNEEELKIGEMLIGSINDDGYLTCTLGELAETTGHELHEIEDVLSIVQEFDPIGVGARDLPECLMLQLARIGMEESPAAEVIQHHLDELGARKYPQIAREIKLTVEEVQKIAHFIATLEPRPGRMFSSEQATYILPEVIVQKVNDEYVVIVNDDQIPHLRISRHYRKLMENPETTKEVKQYIREKIQAGTFLIKSINQRQQTIYRIASEIVKVQQDFLENGVTHLKPLTMA
ncbi:MAG: RNA polymerase sigma-54 factor, partial [Spartobacteria bacterium]|nr:RNA polymerase sigma-54 factor [Spartobacteria bacterium]